MSSVSEHYDNPGLADRILNALAEAGLGPTYSIDDLRPLDEFHVRGRQGTELLAEMAKFQSGSHVIDIGSGLGGPARFNASRSGCRVSGIDLTDEYVRLAQHFALGTGLQDLVSFQTGNALAIPFAESTFDGAWMQHVNMNIADKGALFREVRRVLKPGGIYALHEVVGEPYLPAPWASDPANSFVVSLNDLRVAWESAGFETEQLHDDSDAARAWFAGMKERTEREGMPALGIHLLFGERAGELFGNAGRALADGKLTVFMAVLRAR